MFGSKKIIETIERVLKQHTWRQSYRIEELEREVKDMRTWNQKVREKNAHLRRDRRRLRDLLDANNVPWRS